MEDGLETGESGSRETREKPCLSKRGPGLCGGRAMVLEGVRGQGHEDQREAMGRTSRWIELAQTKGWVSGRTLAI